MGMEVLILNPFTLWLLVGLIAIALIWFSPNRHEFINDMHLLMAREDIDGFTAIMIVYIVLPLSIPQIIKTYKK